MIISFNRLLLEESGWMVKRKIDSMQAGELARWYFAREMRRFHRQPVEARIWIKHLGPIFEELITELKVKDGLANAKVVAKVDEMLDGLRAKHVQEIAVELMQGELLKRQSKQTDESPI